MFGKIERLTVPPQTAVPIRSVVRGERASHGPVEVTVHVKGVAAPARSLRVLEAVPHS